MRDREELGRRIKHVRSQRRRTLKDVEAAAGISATHISEIERGKTSPTMGVLLRIAEALEKDPAYFVEDEDLGDVSRVAVEDRVRESLPGGVGAMDRLTTSIPGGRIDARYIVLSPSMKLGDTHTHPGDEAAVVLSGEVRFTVDGQRYDLSPGDSIYLCAAVPHAYANVSSEVDAVLVWVGSREGLD